MLELLHTIFVQPFYNLLIFLYNTVSWEDFGIAIILMTVLVKFVLLPLSKKQIQTQKQMQEIQPEIKALQAKYKDDKEKQAKKLMEFYKEKKINPFSGCLTLIPQIALLIAMYRVLFLITEADLVVVESELYSFVPNPGEINNMFLGIIDMAEPSIVLAVLAAGAQYIQTKMIMDRRKKDSKDKDVQKKEQKKDDMPDMSEMIQKQMLYIAPALTLFIGIVFPSGLALYLLVSAVFMIVQQYFVINEKENTAQAS